MLLVDKPPGVTSHDVVVATRRALGERRIGHAGTLDPFATGLLVLLLGRGTRLLPYVEGEPKVYEAEIAFGSETDTDDRTGAVVRTAAVPPRQSVEAAFPALTGSLEQIPPAYSAKQVAGRRAYRAARAGESLPLRPVTVTVSRWEPLHWTEDTLHARITCGAGTYIRALARDLGRAAGSAAHLRALRRTRSGPFGVEESYSLDQVAGGSAEPLPLLAALPSLPAEQLDPESAQRVAHGMRVPARGLAPRAALIAPDGALLAIAEREAEGWQPKVVLG